jgi:hypothetical protein
MLDDQLDIPDFLGGQRFERAEEKLEVSGLKGLLVTDEVLRAAREREDMLLRRADLPILQNPPETNRAVARRSRRGSVPSRRA